MSAVQLKNWPFAVRQDGYAVAFGETMLQYNSGLWPFKVTSAGEPIVLPNYLQYTAGADFNTIAAMACFGRTAFQIGRFARDTRAVDLRIAMQREAPDVSLDYCLEMPDQHPSVTPYFTLFNGCGLVQAQALMRRSNSPLSHIGDGALQQSLMDDARAASTHASVLVLTSITVGVSDHMLEFLISKFIPEFRAKGVLIALDLSYRSQQYKDKGGIDTFRARASQLARHADLVFHNFEFGCADLGINPDRYTDEMRARYPNVQVTLSAKRTALPNGTQCYQNFVWAHGTRLFDCMEFQVPCLHRVGCGDANFGAFLHYLLADRTPREAANFGAANGAAKMTMPGDVAQTNAAMIEAMVEQRGKVADVNR